VDEQGTIQIQGAGASSVTAKIERGQRGGYGWTLSALVAQQPGESTSEAFERAISALVVADAQVRRCFGTAEGGETVLKAA
jgi:hypothetical protein